MGRLLFWGYLVAGAAALVLYFALSAPVGRELAWQWLLWGSVAGLLVGARRHRPRRRGPWLLMMAGVGCLAVAGVLEAAWWSEASLASRRELYDYVAAAGYPLIGLGSARLAHAQSAERDHGPVLDSAIVTIALATVLWEGVFTLYEIEAVDASSLTTLLAISLSSSWVAAMTTRMVLAGGYRAASGWLMAGSAAAGFAGAAAFLLTGGQGRLISGGPVDVLWGAALLFIGASALHPSMHRLTEPQANLERAHVWTRTVLPAVALLTPPAAILVRQVTMGQTATVAGAASLVIGALVVLRFAGLVRARERARTESLARAERESALSRLWERSLAGASLPELLAEAEQVLCRQLELPSCRLHVPPHARDPGAPAPALPGSGGLVGVEVEDDTAFGGEAAAFTRAVGHVLESTIARRRDEELLRHQSRHDPLTGLANRTLLDERLALALSRRRTETSTTALAFVDLDGFKSVNDTLGHAAGDRLLQLVGDRLTACVRPTDTVARFAGDEFVVVLDQVAPDGALRLAERIRVALAEPATLGDEPVVVTASVGLSVAPLDDVGAETLLRQADAAMYAAKSAGRPRVGRHPAGPGASPLAREVLGEADAAG